MAVERWVLNALHFGIAEAGDDPGQLALARKIRQTIWNHNHPSLENLIFTDGAFSYRPSERFCIYDGREFVLTPNSNVILGILLITPGLPIRSSDIYSALHPKAPIPHTGARIGLVTTAVSRLSKALNPKKDPSKCRIENVNGFGYRYCPQENPLWENGSPSLEHYKEYLSLLKKGRQNYHSPKVLPESVAWV